jgi:hypothetical protein
VEVLVLTESVELPEVTMDVGLNVPVAPVGSPVTLSVTVPVNPFSGLRVEVKVVLDPAVMVRVDGDAETAKSAGGGALTTSVTEADRVTPLRVPRRLRE